MKVIIAILKIIRDSWRLYLEELKYWNKWEKLIKEWKITSTIPKIKEYK